jgi:hypothetical protein
MLFRAFSKAELDSFIAILLQGTNLRDYARTNLQYRAWNVLSSGTVDAGHTYLLPYESGHDDCWVCGLLNEK